MTGRPMSTFNCWHPADTHNAEIESASGADLQMARAVAHIRDLEARIATLEAALKQVHGTVTRRLAEPSDYNEFTAELIEIATAIEEVPGIIAERGGL